MSKNIAQKSKITSDIVKKIVKFVDSCLNDESVVISKIKLYSVSLLKKYLNV